MLKAIIQLHGGEKRGPNSALLPCPICQSEGRGTQRALSVKTTPNGRLLLHCFRSQCGFQELAKALDIPPERQATRQKMTAEINRDKQKKREYAAKAFKETKPITGTPAEKYLRRRGITIELPKQVVRYHSRLYHPSKTHLPALVAKVQGKDGAGIGMQRIYLDPDGNKARRDPVKASLGPIRGGAVRLGDGDSILLGEGIETVAAAMQLSGLPGYAALSTSGIKSFQAPAHVRAVTLLVDVDANGAGEQACQAAGQRLRQQGIAATLALPKAGEDFNAELLGIAK